MAAVSALDPLLCGSDMHQTSNMIYFKYSADRIPELAVDGLKIPLPVWDCILSSKCDLVVQLCECIYTCICTDSVSEGIEKCHLEDQIGWEIYI